MLFKFLWNGNDKVKRNSTYNDYSEGGLRMPNVDIIIKSLRLAWLQRLLKAKGAFWKTYFFKALEKVGGLIFLKCNYEVNKCQFKLSLFYIELLQFWSDFQNLNCESQQNNEIIWNNKNICIGKEPVFYKKNCSTVELLLMKTLC